uniref:Protein Tat n=1 Tax=Simian immunodeficiency virus agm.vervet (isolate AGM3) TaxID=11730 RepID=TAT_SIVVG|nr:RecName: Full=Protein Tat; AltName: Full=Transactivating regulatory protein [Simian immunodeficiency virus (AGM3 ISOLATE)]AAA91917.1 tat protein [Simian immunodeficiency virus]
MDKGEDEQGAYHQDLIEQLKAPLKRCTNKCYCKCCCYHCQLCFLQKGLGVTYHAPRIRRKKIAPLDRFPEQKQSISTRGRDSQTTQKGQEKVETSARTAPSLGRKNLAQQSGRATGASD